MAKNATAAAPKVSPEEKRAAAAAKRQEAVQNAKASLEKAGMDAGTELDLDQRKRAAEAATKHPSLSGNALKEFILNGKSLREQTQEARGKRAAQEQAQTSEQRSRANLTRSNDPEATEL